MSPAAFLPRPQGLRKPIAKGVVVPSGATCSAQPRLGTFDFPCHHSGLQKPTFKLT